MNRSALPPLVTVLMLVGVYPAHAAAQALLIQVDNDARIPAADPDPAEVESQVFLGFVDGDHRFAVQGAVVAGQPSLMAPDARVRGVNARVVAIINKAATQSETFRGLVDHINHTDGIVYVAEGDCGSGVRACLLLTMTVMGPHRLLRILVDGRVADRDLIASIGHELQHAVEVLNYRSVRSSSQMILLYKRICDVCGGSFETYAAARAGNAVRDELLESAAWAR